MITKPAEKAAGRRLFDSYLLLPALVAGLLLAVGNEDFGFDAAGALDAFAYLGYFWHYPEHAGALADSYKGSRLPWILPGYVLHSITGPVAAEYLLVFATLAAGGVAIYLLVRDIVGDRSAAATLCVAWTSCTWLHGIGGWSYQVLPATNYYLFGLWLTFRAAGQPSRWSAILAGICLICAVHTHLFFAAFLPLVPLMYWAGLTSDTGTLRRARADALRAIAGALGITFALAIVNVATGGTWLFFAPQVALTQQLLERDRWWHDAATWMPVAMYLIVPAVFLIGALAALLVSREHRQSRPVRTLVLQAWLALGVMCVAQFGAKITTLDYSYMAFPLYAYAFPAGGVLLASWHKRQPLVAVLASSAIIVGSLLFLMPVRLPAAMASLATMTMAAGQVAVLPPLLLGLIGCAATLLAPRGVRLLLFGVWFAALNSWIAPSPLSYGINTPGYRRQMFDLFYEFDGLTAAYDPSLKGIHYWFPGELTVTPGRVPLRGVFESFAAIRGGEQSLVGHDPAVPLAQLDLNNLASAECIALLTSAQTAERTEAEWQAHFTALGRPLRRVAVRHFTRPDIAFAVTLVKPADVRDVGGPPCRRRVLPPARR